MNGKRSSFGDIQFSHRSTVPSSVWHSCKHMDESKICSSAFETIKPDKYITKNETMAWENSKNARFTKDWVVLNISDST